MLKLLLLDGFGNWGRTPAFTNNHWSVPYPEEAAMQWKGIGRGSGGEVADSRPNLARNNDSIIIVHDFLHLHMQ
jgi:hypothetical protein